MSQKGQQYKTKHTDITPHIAVAISDASYLILMSERKQDHYVHKNLMLAALGAEIKVLYAQDIAKALTDWCNLAFVTKLVLGQSEQPRWKDYFKQSLIEQINHVPHSKLEIVPIHYIHSNKHKPSSKILSFNCRDYEDACKSVSCSVYGFTT